MTLRIFSTTNRLNAEFQRQLEIGAAFRAAGDRPRGSELVESFRRDSGGATARRQAHGRYPQSQGWLFTRIFSRCGKTPVPTSQANPGPQGVVPDGVDSGAARGPRRSHRGAPAGVAPPDRLLCALPWYSGSAMFRLAFLSVLGALRLGAADADLILYNGKIVTVDSSFSVHQAVAAKAGKITAVGSRPCRARRTRPTHAGDRHGGPHRPAGAF